MQSKFESRGDGTLDNMWESHREYLRRMLIGLSKDIDLADDLLQDTYLRACHGISGYRGGDARAWLAAIAKNVFYSHARRRYVRSETPLDCDIELVDDRCPDHLTLIEIRRALSELTQTLRTTLVMKHYAGYTYEEIAARLGCPTGTAKRRVSVALKKLRQALGAGTEEYAQMKCADLTDRRLLDHV